MSAAIAHEALAHQAALAGDLEAARDAFREAAASYRASWESASPNSFGRLVGMLKASILAGGGAEEATYVEQTLAGRDATSPTASYAQAIAALTLGDDRRAEAWAGLMHGASPAFERAAAAIAALADRQRAAYAGVVGEIVEDFAGRAVHLTGVPIADTALMLEALAERLGMGAAITGPLTPRLAPEDSAGG